MREEGGHFERRVLLMSKMKAENWPLDLTACWQGGLGENGRTTGDSRYRQLLGEILLPRRAKTGEITFPGDCENPVERMSDGGEGRLAIAVSLNSERVGSQHKWRGCIWIEAWLGRGSTLGGWVCVCRVGG